MNDMIGMCTVVQAMVRTPKAGETRADIASVAQQLVRKLKANLPNTISDALESASQSRIRVPAESHRPETCQTKKC